MTVVTRDVNNGYNSIKYNGDVYIMELWSQKWISQMKTLYFHLVVLDLEVILNTIHE